LGETSLEAHAAQEKTPLKFVTMSKSKPNAISKAGLLQSKLFKTNSLGICAVRPDPNQGKFLPTMMSQRHKKGELESSP
jgi:hypothetical protein